MIAGVLTVLYFGIVGAKTLEGIRQYDPQPPPRVQTLEQSWKYPVTVPATETLRAQGLSEATGSVETSAWAELRPLAKFYILLFAFLCIVPILGWPLALASILRHN